MRGEIAADPRDLGPLGHRRRTCIKISAMGTNRRIFVALVVAFCVVVGTQGAADAKRSIALLEIEGARTDRLYKQIRAVVGKRHKVVDEKEYRRAANKLNKKKINPAHIRKVCGYLEIDGVVDGQIVAIDGGYRLILRLHDGVTGKRVWRQKLKLRKQSLSKSIRPKLAKRMLREIGKLGKDEFVDGDDDEADDSEESFEDDDEADDGDDGETRKERRARLRREARERKREARDKKKREAAERREKARERKRERARKRAEERERRRKKKREEVDVSENDDDESFEDDDESDDDDGGGDDFEDDGDEDDGEEVAAADEGDKESEDDDFDEDPLMTGKSSETAATAEGDPREHPLTIWAGGSATARKLQFAFANVTGNDRPPRYKGTPVPGIYLAGELFPLTFSPGKASALRNIGFGFMFDRVLKLNSSVLDTAGNAVADVKTTQQRIGVNVKYRHFLNDSPAMPTVVLMAGYNQNKFVLDKAGVAMGTVIDVPNTTYTFIDPGVGIRYTLGRITVAAEARALLVLDAGEIQDPEQYGAATVTGANGDVMVDYQINPQFSVRVGAHAMTLGYDFKEGTGALQDRDGDGSDDVGGARDNWYGGYVTIGYTYK